VHRTATHPAPSRRSSDPRSAAGPGPAAPSEPGCSSTCPRTGRRRHHLPARYGATAGQDQALTRGHRPGGPPARPSADRPVPAPAPHRCSGPCMLASTPATFQERRLRRRWPGVSAGLSLAEARPAHAGPHPHTAQIQAAHPAGTRAGGGDAVFLVLALSRSGPPRQRRPLRAVARDRDFARPLTRRPLTRDRRLLGRTGKTSHSGPRNGGDIGQMPTGGAWLRARPGSKPQRRVTRAIEGKSQGKAMTNYRLNVDADLMLMSRFARKGAGHSLVSAQRSPRGGRWLLPGYPGFPRQRAAFGWEIVGGCHA
jgi:hypothetical protein